jgi:putative transposase
VFLCADMFRKEVGTFRGLTTAFVFFVIHLQTRRVILSRATFSPTNQWLKQQIRHVLWECEEKGIRPRFFLRDNDILYPREMDSVLSSLGIDIISIPFGAPNANSHAERYILSCKSECLNHLLIFGLDRLQHVIDCYNSFFNEHRPHQGIGDRIPAEYHKSGRREWGGATDNIVRKDFLGGLLRSYSRIAA